MTPETTNRIGNAAVFIIRAALCGLAIYFASESRYFATLVSLFVATCIRWNNDGKLIKDGTEKES
jgi:hypothetical protein